MKASGKLLAVVLAIVVSTLAAGCGGTPPENRELIVGDTGWEESVTLSNLTKVLLEDELGYENVELRTLDVDSLFEGVGDGQLDAFQDVWLPNHQQFLDEQGDDVELLDPWFQGTTEFGIAVPDYVHITSIPELSQTGVDQILGIDPLAAISERIPESVIPTYDLEQEYVGSSTPAMLSEVEGLYDNQEPFAFVAWSPHWMNQRYDIHLLADPEDALGELNDVSELSTVVNEDLRDDDPAAYAFLETLTLTEEQINDLENTANETGDPLAGARQWASANPGVVEPWLDAAEAARKA